MSHSRKMDIKHVENGGEHRLGNYKLDGYVQRPGQKDLAIEIQG
jgi:hypothetical protein